ncbi:hypothetical protein DFJ77DRAFT_471587 [Powellomyces hirtus]|nr:hypothetical protein DFJ77DRAFT_471587 [Powellomyces hirtus]
MRGSADSNAQEQLAPASPLVSAASAPRGRRRGGSVHPNQRSTPTEPDSSSKPSRRSADLPPYNHKSQASNTPRNPPGGGLLSIITMLALAPVRLCIAVLTAMRTFLVAAGSVLGITRPRPSASSERGSSEWSLLAFVDAIDRWWNAAWCWVMEACLGFPLRATIHSHGAVLVTGAGSGIGAHVAQTLAAKNYVVYAGMRTLSPGNSRRSSNLHPIQLDVTSSSQIRAAAEYIESLDIPLIAVVNCAGIPSAPTPMEYVSERDMMQCLDVNVVGPLRIVQHFLPLLRRSKGRIVNVSSVAGFTPSPMHGVFAASKTALETWSDSLRVEVRKWGIAVVIVQPGSVDTALWQKPPHAHQSDGHPSQAMQRLPIATTTTIITPGPPTTIYTPLQTSVTQITAETRKHLISTTHTSRAIFHAITDRYPKTRYLVGVDARLAYLLAHLPDRILDWAFWIALGKDRTE